MHWNCYSGPGRALAFPNWEVVWLSKWLNRDSVASTLLCSDVGRIVIHSADNFLLKVFLVLWTVSRGPESAAYQSPLIRILEHVTTSLVA